MNPLRKRIFSFFALPSRPFLVAAVSAALIASVSFAQNTGSAPPAAGGPPGKPPSDVELVERLMAARHDYQLALEHLRKHYLVVGDVERARWAEEELIQFHRIGKQAYR